MTGKIFISHTTADDSLVKRLRETLEHAGLSTWVDSRQQTGGDELSADVKKAIEEARTFLVVLSPNAVNSGWVPREVKWALNIEKTRGEAGFKVIPILLPGIDKAALGLWFEKEPLAIKVAEGPGGIEQALPQLFSALGEQLPDDLLPPEEKPAVPVADLILELSDLEVRELDKDKGVRRASAKAILHYDPPDLTAPQVSSRPFRFTAPLAWIPTGGEMANIWPCSNS
jgi:hypothetical protein